MSLKWTRAMMEKLIVCYEACANLYNSKHKDYSHRSMRQNSLEFIRDELATMNNAVTIKDIRNKIQVLRGQYAKELRYMLHLKKKDSELESVYVPKLWCFQQMEFLRPYCMTRETISHADTASSQDASEIEEHEVEEYYNDNSNIILEESENLNTSTDNTFQRQNSFTASNLIRKNTRMSENDTKISEEDVSPKRPCRNADYIFGEYVASKLEGYNQRCKNIVQHLISNILFDADMGKYDSQETCALPNPQLLIQPANTSSSQPLTVSSSSFTFPQPIKYEHAYIYSPSHSPHHQQSPHSQQSPSSADNQTTMSVVHELDIHK